jgi:hypothetical protein
MNPKRIPIFPISYFKDNIEDNQYLKDLLVDKILKDSEKLPIPEKWFTNKLRTSFLGEPAGKEIFFGQDTFFQEILQERYTKCLDNFFENIEYTVSIDDIWYNCYVDGEYQELHCHAGESSRRVHFASIHFLSFDSTRHNPVMFEDPLYQLRALSLELYGNNYSANHYPDIKEGDFIMFPSYIKHYVKPSQSTPDYPRITIAMNIRILDYNGKTFI